MPDPKKNSKRFGVIARRRAFKAERADREVPATLIAGDKQEQISMPVSINMSRPAADRLRAFMAHGQNRFVVSSSDGALSVRISMVIARRSSTEEVVPRLGNAAIDWDRGTIAREGRRATLSRTELRLLATLLEHAGETVPHDVLIAGAWGVEPDDAGYNALAVYVCYLRRSLKSIGLAKALCTVRGVGYSLAADGPKAGGQPPAKPKSAARYRLASTTQTHTQHV